MILFHKVGGFLIQFLHRRWLFIVTALIASFILAACGGPPPVTSWPGYTVTNDDIAYLASSSGLGAIDLKGTIVGPLRGWPLPSPNATIGYYSRPALSPDGKTLYVGTEQMNGNQGALEAFTNIERSAEQNPTLLWSYPFTTTDPLPGNIYGAIVYDNGVVYFADGKGQVFALDAQSGHPRWPAPFKTEARIWSSPVVEAQRVYVASQDHHLYAIDEQSGQQAWRFPADDSDIDALVGSPTVAAGTVYFGSFSGTLFAVDAASGQLKWSFKAGASLWDGPAVNDGVLYFGDLSGDLYALDATTGQSVKWTTKLEGGVKATPLVEGGVVYIGTDQNRVYALNQDTGQPVWPAPFSARDGESMLVTPVLKGDVLLMLPNLAGSDPVQLYGLYKSNGQLAWRYPVAKQ